MENHHFSCLNQLEMTIFNSFLYVYQRVSARTFRSTKRNCLGAGDLGSKKRSIWILQKRSLVAGSCMDYFVILLARSNSIMRGQWTGGSIHCSHVTAKTDVVQQHKPPHVDENHRSVAARVGYRDTDVRGASTESGRWWSHAARALPCSSHCMRC